MSALAHELRFSDLDSARDALQRCTDRLHFFAPGVTDAAVGERIELSVLTENDGASVLVRGTVVWRYPKNDTPTGRKAGVGLVVDVNSREDPAYLALTDGLMHLSPPGANLFALLRLRSALSESNADSTAANDTHDHVSEEASESNAQTFVNVQQLVSPSSHEELASSALSSTDKESGAQKPPPSFDRAGPTLVAPLPGDTLLQAGAEEEDTVDGEVLEELAFEGDDTRSEIVLMSQDLQPLDSIDSEEGTAFTPRPVTMLPEEEDDVLFELAQTEFVEALDPVTQPVRAEFDIEVRPLPPPRSYPRYPVPLLKGVAFTFEKKKRTHLVKTLWPPLGTKREGLFVLEEGNLPRPEVTADTGAVIPLAHDERTDPGIERTQLLLPVAVRMRHGNEGEVTTVFEPGETVPSSRAVRFKATKNQGGILEMQVLADELEGEMELLGSIDVAPPKTPRAVKMRFDFALDGTLSVYIPPSSMTPVGAFSTGIIAVPRGADNKSSLLGSLKKKLFD